MIGHFSILKKSKQKIFNKRIHGIDIETYDHNRKLLVTSIYNARGYDQVFIRQKKILYDLKHNRSFKDSILSATNLGFDFFGIFYNHTEKGQFSTLFRGSSLIYAKTKVLNGKFLYNTKDRNAKEIKFLDTMNYCPIGVRKQGELLGLPKLNMIEKIGLKPGDASEWYSMILYNIRDSEISSKFLTFLKDSFEELGATFKDTIASTAMSLFKNKYLKHDYFRHDEDVLLEVMKSYYGGRCEVIKRGTTGELNYYDFCSLYPSVMHDNVFPDPNSMHISFEQTNDKIMQYEGCSHVIIDCPSMKYPLLPVRFEDEFGAKVIFPIGVIDGWYTHVELRKALILGYRILKVDKSIYYTETCRPFKDYVADLYHKRREYQLKENPMQEVCKLLMNSIYGKFCEKFVDRENSIPKDLVTERFLKENEIIEVIEDYVRYIQSSTKPSSHTIPIWGSYVTSYGRLKLYDMIVKHNAYYFDTDSLMTEDEIPSSNELGELKLEMKILEAVLVKPKFYALFGFRKGVPIEEVKIKGFAKGVSYMEILGKRLEMSGRKKKGLDYSEFHNFMQYPRVVYNKFIKFREALRRHMKPNQEVEADKFFSIEDDKRMWKGKFRMNELSDSKPVIVSIGH